MPHPPQLFGSFAGFTHFALQHSRPTPHAASHPVPPLEPPLLVPPLLELVLPELLPLELPPLALDVPPPELPPPELALDPRPPELPPPDPLLPSFEASRFGASAEASSPDEVSKAAPPQ